MAPSPATARREREKDRHAQFHAAAGAALAAWQGVEWALARLYARVIRSGRPVEAAAAFQVVPSVLVRLKMLRVALAGRRSARLAALLRQVEAGFGERTVLAEGLHDGPRTPAALRQMAKCQRQWEKLQADLKKALPPQ
jgi:hypothetical protein